MAIFMAISLLKHLINKWKENVCKTINAVSSKFVKNDGNFHRDFDLGFLWSENLKHRCLFVLMTIL